MDFSTPVWKKDNTTRNWRRRHKKELSADVKTFDVRFLADAISFCEGYGNPFVKELLDRAGLFDEFIEAKTNIARSRVLDKAGDKFDLIFF